MVADYEKKNRNDIALKGGDIVDVIERNDYGKNNAHVQISQEIKWIQTAIHLKEHYTFCPSLAENKFLFSFKNIQ